MNWTQYMETEFYNCFHLVRQVFEDRGIDLGIGNDEQRVARLHDHLFRLCNKVDDPRMFDVVLLRSIPWHVGVVMKPPYFLHVFNTGLPIRGDYTSHLYRQRVDSFWRLKP